MNEVTKIEAKLLPIRLLAVFGLLLVCPAGCIAPAATQASQPTFDPAQAFAGHSHGNGTLTIIFQAPQPFHVESFGHVQSNGEFRLDQIVTFAEGPPEQRYWLLKKTSPANYEGTLSEATGPVKGHTEGAQLELVYALPGGLTMHQTLMLGVSGKIINNTGSITFLGIQIGALHETIMREKRIERPRYESVSLKTDHAWSPIPSKTIRLP